MPLLLALLSLVGCTSLVKKPEVAAVKKVSIVSLFANHKVSKKGGGGVIREWNDSMRLQVAEEALKIFGVEINKLGWGTGDAAKILSTKEYRNLPAYKSYFTPAAMRALALGEDEWKDRRPASDHGTAAQLKEMAAKLGVDAVVLVQLNYCFEPGRHTTVGTGEGVITAAARLQVIDKQGLLVVDTRPLDECAGTREPSRTSTALVGGNMLLGNVPQDKFRTMFAEATTHAAQATMAALREAMKD